MGRRHMAIRPTRKMRAESTPAKIGRRIKKCENFMLFSPVFRLAPGHALAGGVMSGGTLRCHGHARARALKSIDHDLFARLESLAHDAFVVHEWSELARAIVHRVARGQRERQTH